MASKITYQPQPIYPAEARQAGTEGSVLLNVTIGKDGSVTDVQTVEGNSVLAQAAMKAVMNWKYQPTLLNDKPAEVKTQVTVNFSLGQ
jgi:TonB family protein